MKRTVPHQCPVCGGNGLVPAGFYDRTTPTWSTSNTGPETCRSCNGTGIVYGEETDEPDYEFHM